MKTKILIAVWLILAVVGTLLKLKNIDIYGNIILAVSTIIFVYLLITFLLRYLGRAASKQN